MTPMTRVQPTPFALCGCLFLLMIPGLAAAQAPSLESLADPEASLVARLDVARLKRAPSYRQIEGVLVETLGDSGVAEDHARAVLARVDECVLSARFVDMEAEEIVLLARGRFTLDDTTRLIAAPGVTVETRRNHRVMRRGAKAAVFVGTDRFVFGNAALVLAALDRIDGTEPTVPARNATLAGLLAEPTRASRMFALVAVIDGELRTQMRAELGITPLASATAFTIEADLTAQLSTQVALVFPDAAKAAQATTATSAMLTEAARLGTVRTMGLTGVVRATRARASESRAVITGRYGAADVRRLVAIAAARLGPDPVTQTRPANPGR